MRHLFRLAALFAVLVPLSGCSGCGDDGSSDRPLLPPSAAPSGLAATAITTERIDLAWTDNATDEVEYRVERSIDLVTWTQIAVLPADTITYIVRGLAPNTQYHFRVAAANSTTLSAYAGPATAVTPPRTWTEILPAAGPDRAEHSAIYDAAHNRMIIFGGVDQSGFLSDLWQLDLGTLTWSPLTPTPGPAPGARVKHTAIYDSVNQRMIVFGGTSGVLNNEAWALSLPPPGTNPTWTLIPPGPTPPAARRDHSAIYDAANLRMIMFGGNTAAGQRNDVWSLNLSITPPAWTQLSTTAIRPDPREGHSAVYDAVNQRMIVFAGNSGAFNYNDAWTLSLPASGPPVWTFISPTPSPPPPTARLDHAAIFDAGNARMTLYGGDDGGSPPMTTQTFFLNPGSGPTWVIISNAGPATGRFGHSAVFDSANRRLVIFGGWDDNFIPFNDVWVLQL